MSDDKLPEIREAGMPGEIAGSGETPPEGPGKKKRLWKYYIVAAVLVLAGGIAYLYFGGCLRGSGGGDNTAGAQSQAARYTCGMHPFIITDKPGNCPICGMKLTKIEGTPAPAAAAAVSPAPAAKPSGGARKILFYRNPMNPNATSQTPAKDAMGMDFVPVYEDEAKGGGGGNLPEGYATVQVGVERVQLAGIQSATAVRVAISHPVRAVGIVVPDEKRVRRIQSKVEGWIEKLHSNFTGQLVTKGQPLLEIYSPDLVATQREYLLAMAGVDRMKESPYEDAREMSSGLAQAARMRLKLFDVPDSFIAELERTGKVRRTVTLNAPVSGYVTGKEVFEGTRVMPGMDLLTVTDLSRVWIDADLYEYEAQAVRVGQTATIETVADPGAKLKGKVAFIYPTFSPETRTLKVRFEFPNPGLRLKPQMYANVLLDLHSVTGVVIPDSALIETGVRVIAFVDAGDGSFEPREVKVGVRGNGKAQILSGVKAGENVVVGANFLLDSESKLRAALTKMTGSASAPSQPQPQSPPQPQTPPQPKPQSPPQPKPQPPPQPKPQPQGQVDHTGHGGGR
jgi:RND family efflux transporter MFP subunit